MIYFRLGERLALRDGDEAPIALSGRETQILATLLQAGGHPVTVAEIAEQPGWEAWTYDEVRLAMRTHVYQIRKKLGQDVIVSAPNVAYRMGDAYVERCPTCGRIQ